MRHPARLLPYDDLLSGLMREVEAGTVNVAEDGPLRLFKYSDRCTFDKCWSPFSVMARGLILDIEARTVVATPLIKFWNYGEGNAPGQPMEPLPDEPFEVSEKVDGSLGIIFHHAGRWRVATRGSFQSEQAKWAEQWLTDHATLTALIPGTTYLAEIVYNANRIVISYEFEGLVLLSAYWIDGREFDRATLVAAADAIGLRCAPFVACSGITDLLTVAKTLSHNHEGFVVRFASGRRLKIKGDEYCRVHRLVSRVTPLAVWEALAANDPIDEMLLPEEFRLDLQTIRGLLLDKFCLFLSAVEAAHLATQHLEDKGLGLWMKDQSDYPNDIARWIFPCRKKSFLVAVHRAGDLRLRAFETFRPTANRLDGYSPSNAMNRFSEAL